MDDLRKMFLPTGSGSGSANPVPYRHGKDAKFVESLADDDGVDEEQEAHSTFGTRDCAVSFTGFLSAEHHTAFPGGPFSALIPSMCPQDVMAQLQKMEESRDQPEFRYDEFGFRVEVEDGPEQNSRKILSIPFVEDPQHRLKWIAHLEFTHNQVVEELTWSKVEPLLPRSDKLRSMVRQGIPHSLRAHIWPRLCPAILKKQQAPFTYKEIQKSSQNETLAAGKAIEKDVLRTLPTNACFQNLNSVGVPRLRRVLRSVAYLYPEIGYCQGMGVIVCALLLFMEEEESFWMMCSILEDILPASYYSSSLIGLQADQKVLQQLIGHYMPEIDAVLREHDIELSLISLQWFLTLFASVIHMKILVRIWDNLLYEGAVILFQVTLGMLKMHEKDIRSCSNSAELFNILSDLPTGLDDPDVLLEHALRVAPGLTNTIIHGHRKKHLAYLMTEQGYLVGNPEKVPNLPKQKMNRRRLKRSQSVVEHIFGGAPTLGDLDPEDIRLKNVRQTEVLIDLKNAILKVCRHFMSVDPSLHRVACLQPDYSVESHVRDHENFLAIHRSRRRRARALLDFERHDEDELGFRKNDIITIVSQRDEHCWVGELNGFRGWFPAKFVQLLDERSKNYSVLGDDAVSELITDLVRGALCPALKAIFEHGIKRSSVLGGPCHPWLFVEAVAKKEVQKDFESVYSRLVLCKTFRLDEDGKVLTPEELLYRAVQQVNTTHDAKHAQLDVKFRSLVCIGLNEQVLHLWFELLCSSAELVQHWYQRWSFVRSPCWVQIKCELRMLSQFAFSLNPDWEIGGAATTTDVTKPLKEGVRDMLVKHHLFSWDL